MEVKMSGDTMQSFNNSSRRCAHASAIFSPPGFALPKWGAGREAIVFTTRYVRQQGAKAEHTVGLYTVTASSSSPSYSAQKRLYGYGAMRREPAMAGE